MSAGSVERMHALSKDGKDGHVSPKKPKASPVAGLSLSGRDPSNENGQTPNILNAYSLDARTVPPFAVDTAAVSGNQRRSKRLESDQMFKDTFLMSHADKWSEFLQNAGSNPSYTSRIVLERKKHGESTTTSDTKGHAVSKGRSTIVSHHTASSVTEKGEKGEKGEKVGSSSITSETISDNKGYDYESTTDSSYNEEAERVRREIFQDLDGEWEGGKRLDAIFNAPIPENYELSNQRDRSEWLKYIAQLKAFYYLKKEGSKSSMEGHPYDNGMFHSLVNKGKDKFHDKKNSWASLERRKKQQWLPRIRRLLLQSQYLPLSLRFIIGILCIVSLSLATRIYQNSDSTVASIESSIPQQPSTIMALCVNSIAIVYLIYIGYDEFSGKPLGIRDPLGKLRLIMLDLLFIIFSSANLSLTFNTLYDSRWVCTSNGRSISDLPHVGYICHKQRALAAFLFLVLVTWVLTFTISIVRVVERVSSGSPRI